MGVYQEDPSNIISFFKGPDRKNVVLNGGDLKFHGVCHMMPYFSENPKKYGSPPFPSAKNCIPSGKYCTPEG